MMMEILSPAGTGNYRTKVEVVKVISVHKKTPKQPRLNLDKILVKPVDPGYSRVQAIVDVGGRLETQHIDVRKDYLI